MILDEYINIILATLIIVIVIQYVYNKSKNGKKSLKSIPGLKKTDPKFGNLLEIKEHGSLHQFLEHLHKTHGDIVRFYWKDTEVVSICSHELFKAVQHLFDRPSLVFENIRDYIGENCIQFANGTDGKDRRKQYDKAFSHQAIIRYIKVIETTGNETLDQLLREKSQIKSLQQMCLTLATKTISKACFNPSDADEGFFENIITLYTRIFCCLNKRLREGKLYTDMDDESQQYKEDKALFYSIIRELIDKRLKVLETENLDNDNRLLIDEIIFFHGEVANDLIENEVMVFMIGGFHTSGNALAWCLYYLSKYPECQEKLYKEICENPIDFTNSRECYKNIMDMRYLKAVLNETFRLSQLAQFAARVSNEDICLGKYKVPMDTPIILALGVSALDERIFHNSEEFNPNRFLDNTFPSFAFVPFGFAGKRQCPGERFAFLELSIWLIQFMKKYSFSLTDPSMDVQKVYEFITFIGDNVELTLTER